MLKIKEKIKNSKITKYIKELLHYLNTRKSDIKAADERLAGLNVYDLPSIHELTPKQAVILWMIDIIQYGFLLSLIYFPVKYRLTLLLPISFGVLHWFILDFIKELLRIIKGQE